jgi:Protein of unknown function (DUF3631)
VSYDQPDLGNGCDPALAQELLDRCQPLAEGSPVWRYLTETRGLPAPAVHYCAADLRQITPPIPGFDQLAYGVVSLLRDKAGETTGLALEACGPAGERVLVNGRTARKTYCLQPNGVRDALLRVAAVGQGALVAYLVEGRLAKVIAVAALFDSPAIYGGGARGCLGCCVPPEPTVVIVEDARPNGPDEAAKHDRDLERAVDRLILAGRMVQRTGGPPCGCCKDVDQALGQHPAEELRGWIAGAEPAELSLDGHARRLAKIKDPIQRAEALAQVVADKGLRSKVGMVPALREAIARYAGGTPESGADEPEAKGAPLDVVDALPWHEQVDGAAVLDRVAELLELHVIMKPHEAHLVALWCGFTHALDCFWFNPRLAIRSPVKRCGKTTLLDLIEQLAARPLAAANITEAAVFRTIEAVKPSLLIDEADCYLADNAALRSVLNSGHTRTSAHVIRVVPTPAGEQEPRKFSTWAPIAVALIGSLPGTLADRAIDIALQRKPRNTPVRRLRKDRGAELPQLQRKLARFAADHRLALEQADPEPPEALHDRMADNLRPLMAIAEVAGEEWPARAKTAAHMLSDVDDANEDLGVQLLADIRTVFARRKTDGNPDKIWTDELLPALLDMRERPWPEANNGRGLTARGITRLLHPFGIKPEQVRKGTTNKRGYTLSSFKGAFEQYLSATTLQPKETAASSDFQNATPTTDVADENAPKPAETASCSTVADKSPENGAANEDSVPETGNGLDHEPAATAPQGTKCGFCGQLLDGADCAQVDGRWYHSDACAAEAAKPAPPKRKRRIKGARTEPDVKGL